MRRPLLMIALAIAACGDNKQANHPDAPTMPDGNTPDAPPAVATYTTFVIDLITNHTADNTAPVAFASFATLPDPDADNNNTAAYVSLFP